MPYRAGWILTLECGHTRKAFTNKKNSQYGCLICRVPRLNVSAVKNIPQKED